MEDEKCKCPAFHRYPIEVTDLVGNHIHVIPDASKCIDGVIIQQVIPRENGSREHKGDLKTSIHALEETARMAKKDWKLP